MWPSTVLKHVAENTIVTSAKDCEQKMCSLCFVGVLCAHHTLCSEVIMQIALGSVSVNPRAWFSLGRAAVHNGVVVNTVVC